MIRVFSVGWQSPEYLLMAERRVRRQRTGSQKFPLGTPRFFLLWQRRSAFSSGQSHPRDQIAVDQLEFLILRIRPGRNHHMSAGGIFQPTTPQPKTGWVRGRDIDVGQRRGIATKLRSQSQQPQSIAHVFGIWLGTPAFDQLNETIQVIIRAKLAAE